jgi:replicative superfamily II helicase
MTALSCDRNALSLHAGCGRRNQTLVTGTGKSGHFLTARLTFRIQSLRPEQESAMLAVLNGRDALVSLPTGFGKSLIYQVPAMMVERPTIVISPLIALMTDQEPESAAPARFELHIPPYIRCRLPPGGL